MADASPFATEERLLSVWVHKRGHSGRRYDEIRANFALHFNKVCPSEAICVNCRKNISNWFCVTFKTKWKTTEAFGCQSLFGAISSFIAQKDHEETNSKKSKALLLQAMETLGGEEVELLLVHDLGTRCGKWSASRPGRALLPGKWPPVPILQEAGWVPVPVWTQRL
jgi:hypothetical protein